MSSPAKSKKVQLPKKIQILGKTFAVSYVPDLKASDDPKEDIYGETDGYEFTIQVNSSKLNQESTLFHEAIHAALAVSGLDVILDADGKGTTEEALVRCLEHAFAHAIDVQKLSIDNENTI